MNNKNNADLLSLRSLVTDMVTFLTMSFYDRNGNIDLGYSQTKLASIIGLTRAQMSRVANGVSTISTLGFYRLYKVVRERSYLIGVDYAKYIREF